MTNWTSSYPSFISSFTKALVFQKVNRKMFLSRFPLNIFWNTTFLFEDHRSDYPWGKFQSIQHTTRVLLWAMCYHETFFCIWPLLNIVMSLYTNNNVTDIPCVGHHPHTYTHTHIYLFILIMKYIQLEKCYMGKDYSIADTSNVFDVVQLHPMGQELFQMDNEPNPHLISHRKTRCPCSPLCTLTTAQAPPWNSLTPQGRRCLGQKWG